MYGQGVSKTKMLTRPISLKQTEVVTQDREPHKLKSESYCDWKMGPECNDICNGINHHLQTSVCKLEISCKQGEMN